MFDEASFEFRALNLAEQTQACCRPRPRFGVRYGHRCGGHMAFALMPNYLKKEFVIIAALVALLAGQAKAMPYPIEMRRPLACWIDNNYRLNVGSAYAVRKGTQISFKARLADYPYSDYDRTVPLPQDIPAHLSVVLTNQYAPRLAGSCEAWWIQPPVAAPPR